MVEYSTAWLKTQKTHSYVGELGKWQDKGKGAKVFGKECLCQWTAR